MDIVKINIDFEVIPTHNPDRLWIGDMSSWGIAENQSSVILITPPGSIKAIVNTFQKNKLNIFNSTNLELNCLSESENINHPLPDGVWTTTLKSAYTGFEKTRYFLKADLFQLELDRVYIREGLEFDKNKKGFREDLQDIEFLIRVAAAQTRNGDFHKADRDFTQAQELLSKYKNCKSCI